MTGDVAGVTFDNVKYGQSRVAGNADVPLTVSGEARRQRRSLHRMSRWRRSPWTRRSLRRARKSRSPRNPRPARATRGSLAMELRPRAAECGIAFPMPRELSWTGRQMALDASGFCCTWRLAKTVRTRPIRIGRRREWWPWLAGTMPRALRAQRFPALPGRFIPASGPSCRTWPTSTRSSHGESAQPARGPAGLYALCRGVGRLHRHSCRWRLHLLSAGPRRRAAGDRRRGSGEDRAAVCAGLRLAGKRDALRSRIAGAARGKAYLSSGRIALVPARAAPRLLWEGPALPLTDVPPAAYSHPRKDEVRRSTEIKK